MTQRKNEEGELTAGHLGQLKVLTLDIETAPLEVYAWRIWEETVGLDQIKNEWSILSFAAKWLHSDKVIYADTGGRGKKKVRDDKHLLLKIHKLLDEADIVVAQNGKKFDVKKINARMVLLRHQSLFTHQGDRHITGSQEALWLHE